MIATATPVATRTVAMSSSSSSSPLFIVGRKILVFLLAAAAAAESFTTTTLATVAADQHSSSLYQESVVFTDVTPLWFPLEWFESRRIGSVYKHILPGIFVDFNGDSWMDLFSANHHACQQGERPSKYWSIGVSTKKEPPFFEAVEKAMLNVEAEPWVDRNGWIVPSMGTVPMGAGPGDFHGTAVADLDNDGFLDVLMTTGNAKGKSGAPRNGDNMLLFGGPALNNSNTHSKEGAGAIPSLTGGRLTAKRSGLADDEQRGRGIYIADLNLDGMLDVITFADARYKLNNGSDITVPGIAHMNVGNRKFERHPQLREYALAAILTDADKDGRAQEMVIPRAMCIQISELNDDKARNALGQERLDFCSKRPVGTLAVYKYNTAREEMVQISEEFVNATDKPMKDNQGMMFSKILPWSVTSADFDGDLYSDVAVLYRQRIEIHYSSARERGELPKEGHANEVIYFNREKCQGESLRAVDLDNDSEEELFVLCVQPGQHLIFEKFMNSKGESFWIESKEDLGDMAVVGDIVPTKKQLDAILSDQNNYFKHEVALAKEIRKGKLTNARSVTFVDFNNDGYIDPVIAHHRGRVKMYRNNNRQLTGGNHFAVFRLEGTESNIHAIGASVILTVRRPINIDKMGNNETTDTMEIVEEEEGNSVVTADAEPVDSDSSFSSLEEVSSFFLSSDDYYDYKMLREVYAYSHGSDKLGGKDTRLSFGLGKGGVPVSIKITWPNGGTEIIEDEAKLGEALNNPVGMLIKEGKESA